MNDLKEKAEGNNLSCLCYSLDISEFSNIEEIFYDLNNRNITIDILINNAGISHVGLLQDMSIDEWNSSISTNLSSVFFTAFTKALAKELAPSNIQVNAIACGAVDTEMNGHLDDYEKEMLINEIPAGRMATPSDVASFVYGIATSNNYLTGQIINFDGGWL